MSVDVLVIGAGPAGSAAACALARRGIRVALADKASFPRDKVCGDALIPDALAALAELSLQDRVLSRALVLDSVRLFAPDGAFAIIRGRCACVPRETLDDLLRQAAVEAGAEFLPECSVIAPLAEANTVTGARLRRRGGEEFEVRAAVTILATGASAKPLEIFGVSTRAKPSATAARVYYRVDPAFARDVAWLSISYHRFICPGYGWIFPGPDGVFNVGVGYFYDSPPPPVTNIRLLFERFLDVFPLAQEVRRHGVPITALKGAPLRTGLEGAVLGRPGLLVAGEAAGATYSFSGEGIGKSMKTGLIAAETIVAGLASGADPATVATRYATSVAGMLSDRFRAYRLAQRWLAYPALANFLAWRANRGRYVQGQLEALFNETADPRGLFSIAGVMKALVK